MIFNSAMKVEKKNPFLPKFKSLMLLYHVEEEGWGGIKGIKFFLDIKSIQRPIYIQKFLTQKIKTFLTQLYKIPLIMRLPNFLLN